MIEVEGLQGPVGIGDLGVVTGRVRRIGLDAAIDIARRLYTPGNLQGAAGGNVEVTVGEDSPIEGHRHAGAKLQVDALAVEDAELEERHPRVLQHLVEL